MVFLDKTTGYMRRKVNGKNVLEHRYVMEQIKGRKLKRSEDVHHINNNRADNRPENLELRSHGMHNSTFKIERIRISNTAFEYLLKKCIHPESLGDTLDRLLGLPVDHTNHNPDMGIWKSCMYCGKIFYCNHHQIHIRSCCSRICHNRVNATFNRNPLLRTPYTPSEGTRMRLSIAAKNNPTEKDPLTGRFISKK